MTIDEDLRAAAEAWMADDPDPATRAEVARLLADGDADGLTARFGAPLTFGTAGIRGPLGAGPARMNRATVRRVVAGLAAWLGARGADGDVVVGRDARHGSAAFADEAVAVLAGAGFAVRHFTEPVPTPLVAYTVRAVGAAAGVQVTASHNPAGDNGIKVYLAGGLPLGVPHDGEIAAAIAAVGPLATVPVTAPPAAEAPDAMRTGYLEAVRALAGPAPDPAGLRIVVTAMHGVGGDLLVAALADGGFTDVVPVAAQHDPDPDFPTAPRPNPEEPGALDLARALGAEHAADLVLATDPDGDRLAVATPADGWRTLTGDEVGCLLAEHLLDRDAGEPGQPLVATTVVSSRLLARIAEAHDAAYAETLTGFKWLAPVAEGAQAAGQRFVLAYEQALGVMVGDAVRDKDGIAAAVLVATLAADLRAGATTLTDALDGLARRHGVHATAGRSVAVEQPEQVERVLDALRRAPPAAVAGAAVVAVADHAAGLVRHADGSSEPLDTPPADMVGLVLADGSRCLVRPSGTEPVLKCYLEVVEQVAGDGVAVARERAAGRLERLGAAFLALVDR
ncbi:MAG: phospho-sugar mutase [Egibacteraceae bacterium]